MASVMGVSGPIPESTLGFVLPHEHLFTDIRCYCQSEAVDSTGQDFRWQKVSLFNRPQVVQNPWGIVDNAQINDFMSAGEEAAIFASLGGKTIIDLSPCQAMGRNPLGLRQVAEESGVQIVMSAGRYTLPSMSLRDQALGIDDLAALLIQEFTNGVDGIFPGLLKVGFVSKIDDESEIRSLRAVAKVQNKIGCAVAVHPYIWEPISHQILDILDLEGCDLRRVILCHQDYLGNQFEYLDSLIKRGAYIEFDTFGSGWINDPMWQLSDTEKINFLNKQISLGNFDHLLISGDMCLKIMFSRWGGNGYRYIPQVLIPKMLASGIHKDMVHIITEENPARAFCH